MKPYIINFVNSIVLISLGLWAYLSSHTPSMTTLIPVLIGVLMLLLNTGVRKEKKNPSIIVLILIIVVLLGLVKPLMGVLQRTSIIGMVRVIAMILSNIIALFVFIRYLTSRKSK